jgi:hypothetical protein
MGIYIPSALSQQVIIEPWLLSLSRLYPSCSLSSQCLGNWCCNFCLLSCTLNPLSVMVVLWQQTMQSFKLLEQKGFIKYWTLMAWVKCSSMTLTGAKSIFWWVDVGCMAHSPTSTHSCITRTGGNQRVKDGVLTCIWKSLLSIKWLQ